MYNEIWSEMKANLTIREVYVKGSEYTYSVSAKGTDGYKTLSRDAVAKAAEKEKSDEKKDNKPNSAKK